MSDWKDWDKLLGPGTDTESYSGSSEPDGAGHKGTSVIRRRRVPNGKAIFEVVMEAAPPGFAPTAADVVSLEVEGFDNSTCGGKKLCAQFTFLPPNAGLLKPVPGGKLSFEPADNDGGLLSGLLAKCSCGTAGVKSYMVYVTVAFTPPNPAAKLRFSSCTPCGAVEL